MNNNKFTMAENLSEEKNLEKKIIYIYIYIFLKFTYTLMAK